MSTSSDVVIPHGERVGLILRIVFVLVAFPITVVRLVFSFLHWIGDVLESRAHDLWYAWRRQIWRWSGLNKNGEGRSVVMAREEKRQTVMAQLREAGDIMRKEREAAGLPPLIPELTEDSGRYHVLPPYGSLESLQYGSKSPET